jgi:hypothetical protein
VGGDRDILATHLGLPLKKRVLRAFVFGTLDKLALRQRLRRSHPRHETRGGQDMLRFDREGIRSMGNHQHAHFDKPPESEQEQLLRWLNEDSFCV